MNEPLTTLDSAPVRPWVSASPDARSFVRALLTSARRRRCDAEIRSLIQRRASSPTEDMGMTFSTPHLHTMRASITSVAGLASICGRRLDPTKTSRRWSPQCSRKRGRVVAEHPFVPDSSATLPPPPRYLTNGSRLPSCSTRQRARRVSYVDAVRAPARVSPPYRSYSPRRRVATKACRRDACPSGRPDPSNAWLADTCLPRRTPSAGVDFRAVTELVAARDVRLGRLVLRMVGLRDGFRLRGPYHDRAIASLLLELGRGSERRTRLIGPILWRSP